MRTDPNRPSATAQPHPRDPRSGALLFLAVVGYLVLIEGVIQVLYGKIDIPFVEVGLLEFGLGTPADPPRDLPPGRR